MCGLVVSIWVLVWFWRACFGRNSLNLVISTVIRSIEMGSKESGISRRDFLSKTGQAAAGAVAVGALAGCGVGQRVSSVGEGRVIGANDQINMAVIGIRSRGNQLANGFAQIPNVKIKTVCDIDENVLASQAAKFEEAHGYMPAKEYDLRKVLEDKDIDAVAIAAPNHWHALATIWACQAGKHVYCEKPCSHNIWEGRKMIEASRKYDRLVQVGFQNRSISNVRQAMKFLHDGGIGEVYMARGLCYKPRNSFGLFPDSEVPRGVHYDLWLGPAPYRPFNKGRFHYNWHWHWDTGNGDIGNQGPHQFDVARWGLGEDEHPVKVCSMGGYFKFGDVCSQETANTQVATYEYSDGKILQFEVRGLYTNNDDGIGIGNLFYGTEGWMHVNGSNWKTFMGRKNEPGPSSSSAEPAADPLNLAGAGGGGHYGNFIAALRSGKREDQTCDIEVGYMSTVLPHLANISYRLGRCLKFDGKKEKFVNAKDADKMLTRKYRKPYVVPKNV